MAEFSSSRDICNDIFDHPVIAALLEQPDIDIGFDLEDLRQPLEELEKAVEKIPSEELATLLPSEVLTEHREVLTETVDEITEGEVDPDPRLGRLLAVREEHLTPSRQQTPSDVSSPRSPWKRRHNKSGDSPGLPCGTEEILLTREMRAHDLTKQEEEDFLGDITPLTDGNISSRRMPPTTGYETPIQTPCSRPGFGRFVMQRDPDHRHYSQTPQPSPLPFRHQKKDRSPTQQSPSQLGSDSPQQSYFSFMNINDVVPSSWKRSSSAVPWDDRRPYITPPRNSHSPCYVSPINTSGSSISNASPGMPYLKIDTSPTSKSPFPKFPDMWDEIPNDTPRGVGFGRRDTPGRRPVPTGRPRGLFLGGPEETEQHPVSTGRPRGLFLGGPEETEQHPASTGRPRGLFLGGPEETEQHPVPTGRPRGLFLGGPEETEQHPVSTGRPRGLFFGGPQETEQHPVSTGRLRGLFFGGPEETEQYSPSTGCAGEGCGN